MSCISRMADRQWGGNGPTTLAFGGLLLAGWPYCRLQPGRQSERFVIGPALGFAAALRDRWCGGRAPACCLGSSRPPQGAFRPPCSPRRPSRCSPPRFSDPREPRQSLRRVRRGSPPVARRSGWCSAASLTEYPGTGAWWPLRQRPPFGGRSPLLAPCWQLPRLGLSGKARYDVPGRHYGRPAVSSRWSMALTKAPDRRLGEPISR